MNIMPGFGLAMGALGVDLEAETTAWVAAVVGDGGSVSDDRRTLVDELIVNLKADGIWDKLDRLWIFAAENTQSALRDIVAASAATSVNSPTLTTDVGYTGNGTNSYINSGFNPTSHGVNWTQNIATMGVAVANNRTSDAATSVVGAFIASSDRTDLMPKSFGNCLYAANGAVSTQPSNTSTAGLWEINRTGSTSLDLYKDGSLFNAGSSAAAVLVSGTLYVLATNFGSPSQFSTDQVSMVFFGGGFDATDSANMYAHFITYMAGVLGVAESESAEWIMSVYADGGTVSSARRTLVDELITNLKADGIWTKLDRLWLFAAENEKSALRDLVGTNLAARFDGGVPSELVFTADQGFSGTNGRYVSSSFAPSTAGGNYTLNNAHFSIWNLTSGGSNSVAIVNDGGQSQIYARFSDGNAYMPINAANAGAGFSVASTAGFSQANRSASNATQSYKDGSSIGSDTQTSNALSSTPIIYGQGVADQYAAATIGGSLTSGEAADLYTHLETYLTAVGAI